MEIGVGATQTVRGVQAAGAGESEKAVAYFSDAFLMFVGLGAEGVSRLKRAQHAKLDAAEALENLQETKLRLREAAETRLSRDGPNASRAVRSGADRDLSLPVIDGRKRGKVEIRGGRVLIKACASPCEEILEDIRKIRQSLGDNLPPDAAQRLDAAEARVEALIEKYDGLTREQVDAIMNEDLADVFEDMDAAARSIEAGEIGVVDAKQLDEVVTRYRGKGAPGKVGKYTTKIKWGIHDIDARPHGSGYWGKRIPQNNARVDAFELKINPNNESYYLPHPEGGFVQFENLSATALQDGKLIIKPKSIYHVDDLPAFAKNKVIAEAQRQVAAGKKAGLPVEWLVSDQKAVTQLDKLFKSEGIPISVKHFPE